MVDEWTGRWYPEEDYSKYPKEKWCDYDRVCMAIREDSYEPKTSMENLIDMVFLHYDPEYDERWDEERDDRTACMIEWARESGGWSEFDYEC